ncbi:MAG: hypothetical protein KDA91_24430 [Planctomycetaceae bacterium]|nr:hypothetical protein [Planctomycetaceae bacterium]
MKSIIALSIVLPFLTGWIRADEIPGTFSVEVRYLVTHAEVIRNAEISGFATVPARGETDAFSSLKGVQLSLDGPGVYVGTSRAAVECQPPVSIVSVSEDQARRLIVSIEQDESSELLFCPKIVLDAGRTGELSDEVKRPLFVGFAPDVNGVDLTRLKPMTEILREGNRVAVRVQPLSSTVFQLDCGLRMASIRTVREWSTGRGSAMIQVPETATEVLEFSARMQDAQLIFAWWPESQTTPSQPDSPLVRASAFLKNKPERDAVHGVLVRVEPQKLSSDVSPSP